jgi:putative oxidoreductase
MNAQTTYLPALGRLLIAAIFIVSGLEKIAAPGMTQDYIAAGGLPLPLLVYLLTVIVEVGGGVLLVLGCRTRIVALALAVFTLAAALVFHRAFGDQGQMIHFMKNLAIAGGLLQVVAFGAGSFSLDSRR